MRRIVLFTALVATLVAPGGSAADAGGKVVVSRGQPVQIAVVLDKSDVLGALFEKGIRNAVEMAVQSRPTIRGFPIQLNDGFDAPCVTDDAVAQNAEAAAAVVANPQNVAVVGHMCSYAFAAALPPDQGGCPAPTPGTALSIYENAGIVTINGSTTNPCLPSVGPTVFNTTAVPDPGFGEWYSEVTALPSDLLWQTAYQSEFGAAPTEFADLYFDATTLLLLRLQEASRIVDGDLVIDRAALAQAVRNTSRFNGVTCTVTLDPATGFRIDDPAALARCAD